MFADEHDGSQSDDDDDGDKITLEELDENFASLGLDFHSRRGDANASPAREVREREGKNAIRDKVKDARISDMVWLPVSLENWTEPPKIGHMRLFDHGYATRIRRIIVKWIKGRWC